ncbi:MAG: hypothetical protein H6737_10070 [Alphaproteobacteria bacterium]|nr:hypothetical protein [Alphaproteobacteria bacterium]
MNRWITVGAATTAIIFSLACGGGGGYANQAACKSYIEKQNGLPCMKMATVDAGQMCPDQLDMSPIDMTEYYGCMEENAKCNGDIPDLGGQANCSMPTM